MEPATILSGVDRAKELYLAQKASKEELEISSAIEELSGPEREVFDRFGRREGTRITLEIPGHRLIRGRLTDYDRIWWQYHRFWIFWSSEHQSLAAALIAAEKWRRSPASCAFVRPHFR
jgi:hypothetical protein